MGDTGEYSDHREWVVCAYTRREDAQARVTLLETLVAGQRDRSVREGYEVRSMIETRVREAPNGDKDAQIDYTGVSWHIEDLEVKEKF
jgi:hypothetical protein